MRELNLVQLQKVAGGVESIPDRRRREAREAAAEVLGVSTSDLGDLDFNVRPDGTISVNGSGASQFVDAANHRFQSDHDGISDIIIDLALTNLELGGFTDANGMSWNSQDDCWHDAYDQVMDENLVNNAIPGLAAMLQNARAGIWGVIAGGVQAEHEAYREAAEQCGPHDGPAQSF